MLAETLAGAERSAFWLRSITRKPKADLYQNVEWMPRRMDNKCCPEISFPSYNHVKNVATGSHKIIGFIEMKTSVCFYLTSNKNFGALKAKNCCCSFQLVGITWLVPTEWGSCCRDFFPEVFVWHLTVAPQTTVADSLVCQLSNHNS